MIVTSRDTEIQQYLTAASKLQEGIKVSPHEVAKDAVDYLTTKGIKAVAKVDESGNVNVKRLLTE